MSELSVQLSSSCVLVSSNGGGDDAVVCEVKACPDYGDVEVVFFELCAYFVFCFCRAGGAKDDAAEVFAHADVDGGAVLFVLDVVAQ